MFQWRRWVAARLIDILREISKMRASTQHLTDAINALATSVSNGNAQIKTELDALLAANANDDDAAVEASVQKIKDLSASIDTATSAAQAALTTVPPDGGAQPAPAPQQ